MPFTDISLDRKMPNNVESERAVLGAILLDEKAISAAAEILTSDDFYLEAHREIFRAMLALTEEEISIDFTGQHYAMFSPDSASENVLLVLEGRGLRQG
jgi:replicative DNA helicase